MTSNDGKPAPAPRAAFTTAPATVVEIPRGLPSRGHAAGPPLGALIRVVGSPATPSVLPLPSGSCRIGSGPGCDVVINEATVSRVHAELTLRADGIEVHDLGSTNGTFHLGQRIQRAVLSLGARIRLGTVTVVLDADANQLEHVLPHSGTSYRGVLGASAPMQHLFGKLARLEASLTPVLLEGESGVGKETLARALHEGSSISGGPLVTIHCGALPRELVASELFGRNGAFESAHNGTLFLDEIDELPLDAQPVLLRALETREVRIIAATNRDLVDEVHQGRFREDLFYRIAVVRLRVPPLRDRLDDVPALAAQFAGDAGIPALPPPVLEELQSRSWPGNVRELRSTVQAYAALGVLPEATRSKGSMLELALRELADPRRPYAEQKDALIERFTAIWLEELLDLTAGNQSAAARYADLERGDFGRLATKYGLGKGPRGR